MDIIKEINGLPNFPYFFDGDDGKFHIAVLGGHSCESSDSYEYVQVLERIFSEMEKIYEKELLSDDDKIQLAKLMKKLQSFCETRKSGLYTLKEQTDYIEKRSDNEKHQIEIQIQMYKDCRCFYKDYIYNK